MIIDGVTEIEYDPTDTRWETDHWKNGLIVFIAGKDLSMTAVK